MKYFWQTVTAILVVLLFISTQNCSFNKKTAHSNYLALADTVNYFNNRLGSSTATINMLKIDKREFEEIIINKDKELAKLAKDFSQINTLVKYKTITVIDSIPVTYNDSIPYLFKRSGRIDSAWYSFNWQTTQNGFRIDSLTLSTQTTIITGVKQKWFLGTQTLATDITNSNPYLKITGITSAQITIAQPWYKKWYVWLAVGTIGGFIAAQ